MKENSPTSKTRERAVRGHDADFPLPSTGRWIEGEGWSDPTLNKTERTTISFPLSFFVRFALVVPTPRPGPLPVEGRGRIRSLRSANSCASLAAFVVMLIALVQPTVAADPPLQPVPNPQPVLDDLQRKMSSLRSVYLEFTQERHLKLFTEPLKSEGVMLMERPNQIRWETTAPYQSILLGNDKSVAQFERTAGEWKKLKLGFPEMLKRVMEQMS